MSAEIVALLVLLGFVVAAVVFTLVFVVAVDRSVANAQERSAQERSDAARSEEVERDPGPR